MSDEKILQSIERLNSAMARIEKSLGNTQAYDGLAKRHAELRGHMEAAIQRIDRLLKAGGRLRGADMAKIKIKVAGRSYDMLCRDGEEEHLRKLALIVDEKTQEATRALGTMTEARTLLFAAILLADNLQDKQAASAGSISPEIPALVENLAMRMEELAERLEKATPHA